MKRTNVLITMLLAGLLLIVSACEVDGNGDDAAAVPDTDDVELMEDDDQADDAAESEPTPTLEPDPTPTAEPEPTSTPEPEPTATPEPEPEFGTRNNPIPLGETAIVGDWEIRVIEVDPDATERVMEENMFNDPPDEGHQFFIARIAARYVGEESDTFWLGVTLQALDDGGVVYSGMSSYCGVIPDNINDSGEAFPGAEVEGNTCWSVQTDFVDSMMMIAEPSFTFSNDRVFFALHE